MRRMIAWALVAVLALAFAVPAVAQEHFRVYRYPKGEADPPPDPQEPYPWTWPSPWVASGTQGSDTFPPEDLAPGERVYYGSDNIHYADQVKECKIIITYTGPTPYVRMAKAWIFGPTYPVGEPWLDPLHEYLGGGVTRSTFYRMIRPQPDWEYWRVENAEDPGGANCEISNVDLWTNCFNPAPVRDSSWGRIKALFQ